MNNDGEIHNTVFHDVIYVHRIPYYTLNSHIFVHPMVVYDVAQPGIIANNVEGLKGAVSRLS